MLCIANTCHAGLPLWSLKMCLVMRIRLAATLPMESSQPVQHKAVLSATDPYMGSLEPTPSCTAVTGVIFRTHIHDQAQCGDNTSVCAALAAAKNAKVWTWQAPNVGVMKLCALHIVQEDQVGLTSCQSQRA